MKTKRDKLRVIKAFPADIDPTIIQPGTYPLFPMRQQDGAVWWFVSDAACTKEKIDQAIHEGWAEIIPKEEVMEDQKALAVHHESAVIAISPQEQIKQASDMARLLKEVVNKAGLARKLGGRKEHLEFEAWQTIARWHHCTPSTEWTRPIKEGDKIIGWEARVNVIDENGRIIGSSEGMCMSDEANWRGKPSYALRSMAQTRTAGKALRSLFAHIAVLAGYSPTPVEEMDDVDTGNEKPMTPPKESPPEHDSNEVLSVDFIPSVVLKKDGEKGGKPWVKFTIQNGEAKFTTFSKKFAEIAKSANIEGKQIRVAYKAGKFGNDIELVTLVEVQREPGE